MAAPAVDDFTRRYAELVVRVGANVQPGQHVVVAIEAAEHAEFGRAVMTEAWGPRGARDVYLLCVDEVERLAWAYVCNPTPAWARKVFGDADLDRLRDAVATAVRLDEPDPARAWRSTPHTSARWRSSTAARRSLARACCSRISSPTRTSPPTSPTAPVTTRPFQARRSSRPTSSGPPGSTSRLTVHSDLPIGGPEVEVVGLDREGAATPILQGEHWVLS